MSAAEAPKSEQIQANVAAALSRLRGELGASSSPFAGTGPRPVPKTTAEPVAPILGNPPLAPLPTVQPVSTTPLSPTPVAANAALPQISEPQAATRPLEPTLGPVPTSAGAAAPTGDEVGAPRSALIERFRTEAKQRQDREAAAADNPDNQPDLLAGVEVPPAPPPPLASFETEDEVAGRGRRMRNRLLLLVLVLAIAGGGGWIYLKKHQAVEGPVPVITADTTPEKVKPADEGGMQVPNQNVQILDNLNGQASTQNQATVLPPPEQPVTPPAPSPTTSEASAAPQAPAVTETPPAPPSAQAAPTTSAADEAAIPSVPAPAVPSVAAPEPKASALQATTAQQPSTPQPAAQEATPEPAAAAPAEPTPAPAPAAAAAAPTQTASVAAAPAPQPTAQGGAAGVRIQLAAVKSEAAAKAQWAKLQKTYPDLLGALTLNIQSVDKAGTTYYRIQAGPLADKTKAKDLCAKLAAQKQDCIVAK